MITLEKTFLRVMWEGPERSLLGRSIATYTLLRIRLLQPKAEMRWPISLQQKIPLENTMPRSTEEARMLRRLARPINRELRVAGLPVPKTHHCFKVTISAIKMPDWAVRMTLNGFTSTLTSAVLKSRGRAAALAKFDRVKGGKPTWDRFEYRRCNACGRLLVRNEASQMREWERVHPRQKALCGPDCSRDETGS